MTVRSRGQRLGVGNRRVGDTITGGAPDHGAGIPAVKVAGKLVVEDAGADLEQEVGAVWFQRICCF